MNIILRRLIIILSPVILPVFGGRYPCILFKDITEIMSVIIPRLMSDLRSFHIGSPEKLLRSVQSEIDKIFRKSLTALLREDGGEPAVAHIHSLCNILQHQIGITEML